MCWKLVLIAFVCAAVRNAYGLQCFNCTDVESCNNPNPIECDSAAAIQNYQLFASTFNSPKDGVVGCIKANITFSEVAFKPIYTLGCGFANLNETLAKTTSTTSFDYKSCATDLCNYFTATQPTTAPPPLDDIQCYTCDSEPCGNTNSVKCSNQDAMNTINSLPPGLTLPASTNKNNFKCIFLNGTITKDGANVTDIVYKGCIYSDVDVCSKSNIAQGYGEISRNCTQCSTNLCNKTNGSTVLTYNAFLVGAIFAILFGFKMV